MENKFDMAKFKELLDNNHEFPCKYCFKFVAKQDVLADLKERLGTEGEISEKVSAKGNFTSVTLRKNVKSSDDVVAVYESIQGLEGVMTL
ncbi:MAG: DUF493 domain-containing protein [Clostridia bacterium]|jgi:putative lipoic acid-binding regulatory protein|nr:DUF493 domain-containing protein [Clostridia bacterium]